MTDKALVKRSRMFAALCATKPTHKLCGKRVDELVARIEELEAENAEKTEHLNFNLQRNAKLEKVGGAAIRFLKAYDDDAEDDTDRFAIDEALAACEEKDDE